MKTEENKTLLSFTEDPLGSFTFCRQSFSDSIWTELSDCLQGADSVYSKHGKVSSLLLKAIQEANEGTYLLGSVVDFLARVREGELKTYHLASFEFWLIHHSELSEDDKVLIFAKIVGCHIPRAAYQCHLPIGNNLVYEGPHFVAAHRSPDMDTTVCSFQTFLDAFAARVGTTRHFWFLPLGPPKDSHEIERIFVEPLGEEVFETVAYTENTVRVSALDLLSQKHIRTKQLSDVSFGNDEERRENAVILTDSSGCYLGDWRSIDFDVVRSVVNHFDALIVQFQNFFLKEVITFFSVNNVSKYDVEKLISRVLEKRLDDLQLAEKWTDKQQQNLSDFIQKILEVPDGMHATWHEVFTALQPKGFFTKFPQELQGLVSAQIFHTTEAVIDDRSVILTELKDLIAVGVDEFSAFRDYLDTLEIAYRIKEEVLGLGATTLSHLSEYEDIKDTIQNYQYLTVTYKEGDKQYILGVVQAKSLQRPSIGTMALRDFSNFEETDVPDYMQVISVLDHHKSSIITSRPYSNITMDAQSANSILAHLKMEVYDRYTAQGMSLESTQAQIDKLNSEPDSQPKMRKLQNLYRKKQILQSNSPYWVSVDREGLDYLQFLLAIFDDTDMLTKVTEFDLQVVRRLINRLKTIQCKEEAEIVDFDDIAKDKEFVTKAAAKLLQNKDVYSIYTSNYTARNENNEMLIKQAAKDVEAPFFQDTKILNKYACVTQFKCYSDNAQSIAKYRSNIQKTWVERCKEMHEKDPTIRFFLFMMSTIASAEELYQQKGLPEGYRDQIWYWIPEGDKKAGHHLQKFLSGFSQSPRMEKQKIDIEFVGKGNHTLEEAFREGLHVEAHASAFTRGPQIAIQYVDPMSEDYTKNHEDYDKKIYYTTLDAQKTEILRMYEDKGIEVLIAGGPLDTALFNALESSLEIKFTRIDANIDDHILDPSKEKTLLDQDGRSEGAVLADTIKKLLGKEEIEVQAKSLTSETLPGFVQIDEHSRRMRDYLAMTQKEMPQAILGKHTLVVNTNHPLIETLPKIQTTDEKLAKEVVEHIYEISLLSQAELHPDKLGTFVDRSNQILFSLSQQIAQKEEVKEQPKDQAAESSAS